MQIAHIEKVEKQAFLEILQELSNHFLKKMPTEYRVLELKNSCFPSNSLSEVPNTFLLVVFWKNQGVKTSDLDLFFIHFICVNTLEV